MTSTDDDAVALARMDAAGQLAWRLLELAIPYRASLPVPQPTVVEAAMELLMARVELKTQILAHCGTPESSQ